MGVKVKLGYFGNDIGWGNLETKVFWKSFHACPQVLDPLACDIVASNKCQDAWGENGRHENVVHVAITIIGMSGQDGYTRTNTYRSPFCKSPRPFACQHS